MNTAVLSEQKAVGESDIDPIEEIRMRIWARKNYAPAEERDDGLHPIIIDEMVRKDHEA